MYVTALQDGSDTGDGDDDGVALAMERIILEAYRLMQAGQPQQAEYLLIEGPAPSLSPTLKMRACADGPLAVRSGLCGWSRAQHAHTILHWLGAYGREHPCVASSCEAGGMSRAGVNSFSDELGDDAAALSQLWDQLALLQFIQVLCYTGCLGAPHHEGHLQRDSV